MYSMAIPRASQLLESRKRSRAGSELENNDSVDVNSEVLLNLVSELVMSWNSLMTFPGGGLTSGHFINSVFLQLASLINRFALD